jgi:chromosomal replication initiator protein
MTEMLSMWRGKVAQFPTKKRIAEGVCERHGITVGELVSAARHKHLAYARREFCYLAIEACRWSSPEIGRWLGGRDHTTVLYADERYREAHGLPPRSKRAGSPFYCRAEVTG